MSQIAFQNGFVCGMATRGLVRTGKPYQPHCWNDSGRYESFYIDFGRSMRPFSTGMFHASVIVFDAVQLPVSAVREAFTRNPYAPLSHTAKLATEACQYQDTAYKDGVVLTYEVV